MSDLKLASPTKDLSKSGVNELGYRVMETDAQVITESEVVPGDVATYLDALAVDEVLETGDIVMGPTVGILFSGTKDVPFQNQARIVPPQVILYDRQFVTQPLPSVGYVTDPTLYGGYPLVGGTYYVVYTTKVNVTNQSFNDFVTGPKIYVLKDKSRAQ